jgi:hypothetical protein
MGKQYVLTMTAAGRKTVNLLKHNNVRVTSNYTLSMDPVPTIYYAAQVAFS